MAFIKIAINKSIINHIKIDYKNSLFLYAYSITNIFNFTKQILTFLYLVNNNFHIDINFHKFLNKTACLPLQIKYNFALFGQSLYICT